MRKTGAVLGGNTVLRFLLGLEPTEQDLEIYVPQGEHGDTLISNVIQTMGLEPVDAVPLDPVQATRKGIRRISKFKLSTGAIARSRAVAVISTFQNVLLPISQSWTTATLSYISADSVYTVYPELTFARRAIARSPDWDLPEIAKSGSFRPLAALPPSGREAVKALDELGFETRRFFSWDDAPCNRSCGPIPQSFDSPGGFEVVFGSQAMPIYRPYRFAGRNIHFVLRGECRNRNCDNYGDVLCVSRKLVIPPAN